MAKEAPSLHEVRLALLDTNPVFQCLRVELILHFFVVPQKDVKNLFHSEEG